GRVGHAGQTALRLLLRRSGRHLEAPSARDDPRARRRRGARVGARSAPGERPDPRPADGCAGCGGYRARRVRRGERALPSDRVPGLPSELDAPPEPNLHPAELAMRWAWVHRHAGVSNAFRAELLHLARTKAIDVVPTGTVTESKDYLLTLKAVPADPIDEHF